MKKTRISFLLIISMAYGLTGCTDDEINSTTRALSGAYNGYYARPAYYGAPATSTTVVTPAPVPYAY